MVSCTQVGIWAVAGMAMPTHAQPPLVQDVGPQDGAAGANVLHLGVQWTYQGANGEWQVSAWRAQQSPLQDSHLAPPFVPHPSLAPPSPYLTAACPGHQGPVSLRQLQVMLDRHDLHDATLVQHPWVPTPTRLLMILRGSEAGQPDAVPAQQPGQALIPAGTGRGGRGLGRGRGRGRGRGPEPGPGPGPGVRADGAAAADAEPKLPASGKSGAQKKPAVQQKARPASPSTSSTTSSEHQPPAEAREPAKKKARHASPPRPPVLQAVASSAVPPPLRVAAPAPPAGNAPAAPQRQPAVAKPSPPSTAPSAAAKAAAPPRPLLPQLRARGSGRRAGLHWPPRSHGVVGTWQAMTVGQMAPAC